MKNIALLLACLLILTSCNKNEDLDTCQLEKFVQENPLNASFHYDFLTLKDGRIEKMVSYDLNSKKDTLNKVIAFFEYNQKGKVKAVRDEGNPNRIKRYDAIFDNNGNVKQITQSTNGNIEDEIDIEYDSQNRPVSIISRYLIGITRSIEYDNNGNPQSIFRADLGFTPTITEHKFDDKRNLFAGIPAIQFYWIIRPLSLFLPFGEHNIVSSKVFVFDDTKFTEAVNQQTRRELVYNSKGFPETIKVIREDLSSTVANISTLSYNCE